MDLMIRKPHGRDMALGIPGPVAARHTGVTNLAQTNIVDSPPALWGGEFPSALGFLSMMIALNWAGNFAVLLCSVILIVALFSEAGGRKDHT
jgi:hypothetical protein